MSTNAPVAILYNGSPYTVPPDQLDQAIRAGAVIETPEQQLQRAQMKEAQAGSSIPAVAGAALGSLPFVGGSLEKAIDPTGIQAQAHPIAHMAGTGLGLAGQVAGMVATGGGEAALEGAGLLGEGGTAAMGTLGRATTRALIGSAEGGIYGAGGAVNDAVLGNHPLTAEMLISHAAGGALLGGTLAGGLSLGGDIAGDMLERVGNTARLKTIGNIVDTDLASLKEAGLEGGGINRAFREGIVEPGDTPLSVQSKLAGKMQEVQRELGELGNKIDSSGQTVDLRRMIVKQGTESGEPEFSNLLQKGDEAASFQRVAALRQKLAPQTSKAAKGLLLDLDDAILSKAGNISAEVGEGARTLLSDQRNFYGPLSQAADEAVASGHVPKAGNALDALLRQGSHMTMWGVVGKMAGGNLAAPFVAMSGANFLRKVAMNPELIAQTFLKGTAGVAKAAGVSSEALEAAIAASLKGSAHAAGPASSVVASLALPHHATDADVEKVRARLGAATKATIVGNPHVAGALQLQRQVLASALPPPAAHPYLPKSLQRAELGPDPKAIQRYNQVLGTIAHPMGVVANIGRGMATKMETDTLHAVYPNLSMRAGKMLLNASADSGKTASASLRKAIETLTGQAFDPALDPAKIARIQMAAFAPAQPPGKGGANGQNSGVKVNQKGLSSLDLGERTSMGMSGELDSGK